MPELNTSVRPEPIIIIIIIIGPLSHIGAGAFFKCGNGINV